jgi:GTPase
VLNKRDRDRDAAKRLAAVYQGAVAISALSGDGIDALLATIGDRLRALSRIVELHIPYDRGDAIAAVHREGEVVSEAHTDGGVVIRARLDDASAGKLAEFVAAP